MKRIALVVVVGVMMTALAGAAAFADSGDAGDSEVEAALAEVRLATAKYHDVSAALAAEYEATDHCIEGMGYHYEKPSLMKDGEFDHRKPEILLYAPEADGELKLVAVEYLVEEKRTDERPEFFGVPFNGPMPGHEPGMASHYDLHAWVWRDNPDGVFASFNPRVSC